MKPLHTLPAIIAGVIFAPMAVADVTAEDVWAHISELSAYTGQTFEGTPAKSGDTLTVSDLSMSLATPEGVFSISLGSIDIIEQGDGTAKITWQEQVTLEVDGSVTPDQSAEVAFKVSMDMTHTGLDTIVSGDPDNITFSYPSEDATITFANINIAEPALPAEITYALSGTVALSGFDASGSSNVAGGLQLNSTTAAALLTGAFNGSFSDGTDSGAIDIEFNLADFDYSRIMSMTAAAQSPQMLDMIKAGANIATDYSAGAGQMSISVDTPEGEVAAEFSVDGMQSTSKLADGVVEGSGIETGLNMVVRADAMPFPALSFAIAKIEGALRLPLAVSDENDDIALKMALNGVEIDDTLWNLFDPSAQLPRDPADLVIDLSGAGRWFVDITDPEVQNNLDGLPGELSSVEINELNVAAAGAELTGTGAFTFDYNDFTTFPGAPKPTGQANVELSGLNGLLDTLVEMGLIPNDQVLGVRMMLGIFAKAGAEPDTLESELVVTEDGQVLANGQRLR